jgi:hypothetical protein
MTHAPIRTRRWLARLAPVVISDWPLKAVVGTASVTLFFVVYFFLLRHPLFPVTTMPLTFLDRIIPFQPAALVPYASLWLYVFLVPALLEQRCEWLDYGVRATLLAAFGFVIFILWPTAVPASDVDWTRYPSLEFLKKLDRAGNACPSPHAAFATFTAAWLRRSLTRTHAPRWVRLLNPLWCAAILYSTVATRQHVAIDMVAGSVLGLAGAAFSPRSQRALAPALPHKA